MIEKAAEKARNGQDQINQARERAETAYSFAQTNYSRIWHLDRRVAQMERDLWFLLPRLDEQRKALRPEDV